MPHPLEHVVVLKVMTTKDTKPEAMVAKAINDSIAEVSHLRAKFVVSGSPSHLCRRILITLCTDSLIHTQICKFISFFIGRVGSCKDTNGSSARQGGREGSRSRNSSFNTTASSTGSATASRTNCHTRIISAWCISS